MMKIHRVQQLNQELFARMAAGFEPTEAVLTVALWLSRNGVWLALIGIVWAAWRFQGQRRFLLSVVLLCGVATIVSHGIANMANSPRPFMLGLSPHYLAHSARAGFPSAHSAAMWCLAFACFQQNDLRTLGWWLCVCAATTTWARVYSGAHFPLDIAAGMLLAAFLALCFKLARWTAQTLGSSARAFLHPGCATEASVRQHPQQRPERS
ncbi:MAG: phosphatase PAP2 family protein [Xylophilus ampelinus]